MDVTWSTVIAGRGAWIDLAAFGLLAVIHLGAWLESRQPLGATPAERTAAETSIRSAVTAGMTAVGVLIPVSLVAVRVGTPDAVPPSVLLDVFIAQCWFFLALFLGLFVLWVNAARASTENVLNLKIVGLPYGWQLLALLTGLGRLLVGVRTLVESL